MKSDFERASFYGYYQLKLFDSLHLTAGATYDWERFPLNINGPPLSSQEDERAGSRPRSAWIGRRRTAPACAPITPAP
jgi:hypothetical protein